MKQRRLCYGSALSLCPGRILAASYWLPLLVILVRLMRLVASGENFREINPKYSFNEHFARQPFKREDDVQRIAEGLAKPIVT